MPGDFDPEGIEKRLLLQSADFAGARVLEVGSGDARLTLRYAGAAAQVVGVDPDRAAIGAALSASREAGNRNVSFVHGSAQILPFRKNSFDIAVLAWSL